jgi:hypothetical protein
MQGVLRLSLNTSTIVYGHVTIYDDLIENNHIQRDMIIYYISSHRTGN